MICNETEMGWEIIFQRAHALLAAKLVEHWHGKHRQARWLETLNAIAQHDNGWQEWETGDRLTEAGIPRDFADMALTQVVLQARRVVTRAWHQSLWGGLLVSRHLSYLYGPRRGEYGPLDELLDEQEAMRQQWRRWLGVDRKAVDEGYALLRWADSFSLLLCRGDLPSGDRKVQIGEGPGGRQYDLGRRPDGTLLVTPWPYRMHTFSVEVETHHVRQRTFAGEDALANALRGATVTRRRWELWTD